MAAVVDMKPTKLFIGGISQNTTTKDLRAHFGKYGRVLDCVAMRRDDGRSRSFGYVTLDSPDAADKCVYEAQTIDGRVVDVKRAVPERSARDRAPTAVSADKADSKRKVRTRSGKEAWGAEDWMAARSPKSEGLNVDAQEFTPLTDSTAASFEDLLDLETAENELATSPKAAPAVPALLNIRAPPGLAPPPGVSAPPGFLPLTGLPTTGLPPPPAVAPPPRPVTPIPEENEKLCDVNDEVSTAPPSQSTSPETVLVDVADDSDEEGAEGLALDGELPSLGSALHATGSCSPCNFFSKGRCANAQDCTFCHMAHQKRKPTRQEKRERKAAWLARQQVQPLQPVQQVENLVVKLEREPLADKVVEASPQAATAAVHCMFNFDNYSDFSDDEDEETRLRDVAVAKENEHARWTRESLLGIKAAMMNAAMF